jgi:hypothetical protein
MMPASIAAPAAAPSAAPLPAPSVPPPAAHAIAAGPPAAQSARPPPPPPRPPNNAPAPPPRAVKKPGQSVSLLSSGGHSPNGSEKLIGFHSHAASSHPTDSRSRCGFFALPRSDRRVSLRISETPGCEFSPATAGPLLLLAVRRSPPSGPRRKIAPGACGCDGWRGGAARATGRSPLRPADRPQERLPPAPGLHNPALREVPQALRAGRRPGRVTSDYVKAAHSAAGPGAGAAVPLKRGPLRGGVGLLAPPLLPQCSS